ncbi:hypothetical protein [Pseudomonas entomophila]|uniref:Uncharacterized protein n=2 Tax=Pseudomonas entomophila TaxID=312306 RepID=Q1I514_PSEE4|nr:hypothetical protein [Pseudomonas entomophila]WMW07014.1 hypothetical protein RAH46_06670 [Pseudomonas entomophila]CAK17272.1 hypothetical protein PSEEN4594 [Pseudomonas entomophila L48]
MIAVQVFFVLTVKGDRFIFAEGVVSNIFINDARRVGREDYVVVFKANSVQMASIEQDRHYEYVHKRPLRLNEVIHTGKNPYGTMSEIPYEQRLQMTNSQIATRRGKCCE